MIDSEEDPHDVTGALKKYLRNLETPLVPASLYHELISFNGEKVSSLTFAYIYMYIRNCR